MWRQQGQCRELKAELEHVQKQLRDHIEMVRELRGKNEELKEQHGLIEMEMSSMSKALGALRRDMVEVIKERDECKRLMVEVIKERDEYKRLSEENEVDREMMEGMMKRERQYGKNYRAAKKQLEECEASKM